VNLDSVSVEGDVDRAGEIRPEDRRPGRGQPFDDLTRRMAVVVAGADGDRSHPRSRGCNELVAARGPAAVVAGLEEIDRRQPAPHQRVLDVGLRVAGEQEPPSVVGAEQHDRAVVDDAAIVGGRGRDAVLIGPQHLDGHPVEHEAVPGGEPRGRRPG